MVVWRNVWSGLRGAGRGPNSDPRMREMQLLLDISQALLATQDVAAFLLRCIEDIKKNCPYDVAAVRIFDRDQIKFEWSVERGFTTPPDPDALDPRVRQFLNGQPMVHEDLGERQGFPRLRTEGVVSLVRIPILAEDALLGHLVLGYRSRRRVPPAEVNLMSAIGNQIGIAVAKARLYEEAQKQLQLREEAEEQLRQSQKMEAIGALAGGVAHDFNNLLTAIDGASGLLIRELDPESDAHRYAAEIQKASERAGELTRQLLAFSRRQVLQPTALSANAVVTELGRLLKRLLGEDVDLALELEPGLGLVRADGAQLGQVLLNLATNARDAMPAGGKLTIRTSNVEADRKMVTVGGSLPPGSYVCLSVTDTGVGMDQKVRARAFEPFFTTKEPGRGTGLGLSTAYGIVKQSGGEMVVKTRPGQGTTFSIFLPELAEPVEEGRRAASELDGPVGTETILLVEDEPGVREVAGDVLRLAGYSLLSASGPEEARRLEETAGRTIDLLLTDVVMPGGGGHQLAMDLAAARPDMRVLYMSGYTADVALRHGVAEAKVAFLKKPFSPSTLLKKVREVLDAS